MIKFTRPIVKNDETYRYALLDHILYKVIQVKDGHWTVPIETTKHGQHVIRTHTEYDNYEDYSHVCHFISENGDHPPKDACNYTENLTDKEKEVVIDISPIYNGFTVAIELLEVGWKYWLDQIKRFASTDDVLENQGTILTEAEKLS